MDFGEYLEEKRISRNYTIRLFARRVNISYTYLADVEKGRSKAFKFEILNKIVEVLQLDEKETDMFYDLAGKNRDTIPPDIEEYLKQNKELIEEIRRIKRGKKMKENIIAKDMLNRFKESIDVREEDLGKHKNNISILNSLYGLISKDKTIDMIFEFKKEEIEQEQKNIDKLKEIYNKYKNKLKEIEDEIK